MPSLAVHFAVGNLMVEKLNITDKVAFREGIKMPDILGLESHEKKESVHFSDERLPNMTMKERFCTKVNLVKFFENYVLNNDFDLGYYVHLMTDYYFFNCFIYREEFEDKTFTYGTIYNDYEKIARDMEITYGVDNSDTPWAGKMQEGEPEVFARKDIHKFIKICANIDIFKLKHDILENPNNWRKIANEFYFKLANEN